MYYSLELDIYFMQLMILLPVNIELINDLILCYSVIVHTEL